MRYQPNPHFMRLFEMFTSAPDSIGQNLQRRLGEAHADAPLLLATGTDLVLFPGGGRPPTSVDFRKGTKGFFEITAVSHLGLAIPYLARLRELGDFGCKTAARELIEQCRVVQDFNSVSYWRDEVAVTAWRGREEKITDLVDYTCATTADYLGRAIENPKLLNFEHMRANLLEGDGPDAVPVPFNDMMAATFALSALDSVHRSLKWLHEQSIDWARLMVIVTGGAGRPSAGLTWQSNNLCPLLYEASGHQLDPARLIIAPTAPAIGPEQLADREVCARAEAQYRTFWYGCLSSVEMSRLMWPDYPAFQKRIDQAPVVDADTEVVEAMPRVRSVHDKRAIVTRLRYVMEDPGAQIATAGVQFVLDQLSANGNRPELVELPGFTHTTYPAGARR
ncbi:DUF5624 domain-containing protein [Saccharothrix coeruleofusca]|uniref:DUF5624 domain-containing protein n=1 Tax=Saccharothrix coeruleofusca TaxID=33919 RepID=A0A918AFQ9_9PSEU|nr:DUF5624 domain-containing protein [Saccharothrix coeruleofusca]GGP33972.1 hypothetical protein GCM10010185_00430 [Saccharothrix coeruleofusca]